ncbi:sensor histidine kinase [Actinocrispum wychmicini]|uniref:histidine kinase n=1 Tax=Actinocrispum wychmicini TaxID=1213861 RepID=A0A4R2JHI4_9PSEU|nr:histidine kinase [Actinocrispum wychmicini]TCO53585.1 histidine kinase [Actinocrispum wychmicini]
MAAVAVRVFGPVVRRLTYRRWTYLVLGAALIVPFVLAAVLLVPPVLDGVLPRDAARAPLVVAVAMAVMILGLAAATSFIPALRVVDGTAARELLGHGIPEQASARATNLEARWKTCQWFLVHVVLGAVIGALTLVVPFGLVLSVTAPFTGVWFRFGDTQLTVPVGWRSAWVPLASVGAALLLVHLINLFGAALTRLGPMLLGATPADRLAALQRRTEQLAERNRLARELHDSVGHALSVVTIQAGAAGRVLDTDPRFAHKALAAIEDAARGALADLDHVLGLLREDVPSTSPHHTMTDMDGLIGTMRDAGVEIDARIKGDLAAVPFAVSTEAYRIVQECLTNALRHAEGASVTLVVTAEAETLTVEAVNPLGERVSTSGGGRGIEGMRERVTVLRGQITAGPVDGTWRVRAAIPLRTGG